MCSSRLQASHRYEQRRLNLITLFEFLKVTIVSILLVTKLQSFLKITHLIASTNLSCLFIVLFCFILLILTIIFSYVDLFQSMFD